MLKLLKTNDDSYTLYNESLDETYHSRHGAIQESRHVFIQNGLQYLAPKLPSVSILEIGLGTGLNALLTYLEFEKNNIDINYTGIEPFPLEEAIISQLNYTTLLQLNEEQLRFYIEMHKGKALGQNEYHKQFQFQLLHNEFLQCSLTPVFDLIYFDAFAPGKQSEMWNEDTFNYCYRLLNSEGVLVTYCAKGDVKRTMKKVGFSVESLAGPPGKREMIRAIKSVK